MFDHVVLVTIDTLRADHLGSYGYPRPTSPFIDSLAAEGARFEQAISASSHTAPSHASLFTSHYPASHGVLFNGGASLDGIPTIASLFRSVGFETAAFMSVQFLAQLTSGFETVAHKTRPGGRHWSAREVITAAEEWFAGRDPERRFLLWVHLYDVHGSDRRRQAHPDNEHRLRLSEHFRSNADEVRSVWLEGHGLPTEVVRDPSQIEIYDAQISLVDSELRQLFDVISQSNPEERILWVITADHGEGLGNHSYKGHGKHLYEEQVRVPLILFGGQGKQGWDAGVVIPQLVRHVDVLPTLAELAGVEIDPEALAIEGQSLVPLLFGDEGSWDPRLAFAQRRPADRARLANGWSPGLVHSVRDERYKFILRTEGANEFYDLAEDPLESHNLTADDSPEKERLRAWLTQKYDSMAANPLGRVDENHIQKKYVEELRALGYLQ